MNMNTFTLLTFVLIFLLGIGTGAWINANIHLGSHHPNLDVPLYASGIYGVIILVVVLFRPEGMIPSKRRAAELHEGVHDDPLYDAQHAGAEA